MEGNLKLGLKYFVYVICFLLILLLGAKLQDCLKLGTNIFLNICFPTIFSVVVGLFLGLPLLVTRSKSSGKWRINETILLFVGLPTFIAAMLPIAYFTPGIGRFLVISPLIPLTNLFFKYISFRFSVGILFGYSLLYCLEKDNKGVRGFVYPKDCSSKF